MRFVRPTAERLAEFLGMIFGNDTLEVVEDTPGRLRDRHIAVFTDDEGALAAFCLCDKPFVAYAGAALSMIPASVANEAVANDDITESMLENFAEVMNILSRLMMSDYSAHLKLDRTAPPLEAAAILNKLENRIQQATSFIVKIPRYGDAAMTFFVG